MQISIANAQFNTLIFTVLFWTLLILSIRKPKTEAFFASFRTQELKGFAILAIIFSHIGYFLSTDQRFLYPMSILAGVGVNLFLFLSGFGLTVSSLKLPLPIYRFYLKRLRKLFVPMWVIITLFLLMDFFILQKSYQFDEIYNSFLGFFPVADLFENLNSPLWYFSLILFYYLIFPLVFFKRFAYLAPILILLISYYLLKVNLPFEIDKDVVNLYKLHFAPFPLGVLFAILINDEKLMHFKIKVKELFFEGLKFFWIGVFAYGFLYYSIHAGTDLSKTIEQIISLITMFCLIFLFIAKNVEVRLFSVFGIFSYEIYLIHWPILSRYDYFYKYLPAWIATLLYLGLFLGLGYLLHRLTRRLSG